MNHNIISLKRFFWHFRKSSTQKRLFFTYVITYIPLLLFMFADIRYANQLLIQQSIQYNDNTISLQIATIDNDLHHTSSYLYSFLLNENLSRNISSPENTLDTQIFIQNSFRSYLDTYDGCCSLFFYSPKQDILIIRSSSYDTFYERREIKEYIRQQCTVQEEDSQTPGVTGWTFHTIGERPSAW